MTLVICEVDSETLMSSKGSCSQSRYPICQMARPSDKWTCEEAEGESWGEPRMGCWPGLPHINDECRMFAASGRAPDPQGSSLPGMFFCLIRACPCSIDERRNNDSATRRTHLHQLLECRDYPESSHARWTNSATCGATELPAGPVEREAMNRRACPHIS